MSNTLPKWSAGEVKSAYKVEKKSMGIKVSSSSDAFKYILPYFEECLDHREMIVAIYLSRRNQIIGHSIIGLGGVAGCVCDPKIVFQDALTCNASAVILAHNHPSGNLKPSGSDDSITKKIYEGGSILDIELLDHLILAQDEYSVKYFSYKDEHKL